MSSDNPHRQMNLRGLDVPRGNSGRPGASGTGAENDTIPLSGMNNDGGPTDGAKRQPHASSPSASAKLNPRRNANFFRMLLLDFPVVLLCELLLALGLLQCRVKAFFLRRQIRRERAAICKLSAQNGDLLLRLGETVKGEVNAGPGDLGNRKVGEEFHGVGDVAHGLARGISGSDPVNRGGAR